MRCTKTGRHLQAWWGLVERRSVIAWEQFMQVGPPNSIAAKAAGCRLYNCVGLEMTREPITCIRLTQGISTQELIAGRIMTALARVESSRSRR